MWGNKPCCSESTMPPAMERWRLDKKKKNYHHAAKRIGLTDTAFLLQRLKMHRAFSFPITVERSRTKDRLEASLAGICELELRKQRQECLVFGALALGDSMPQNSYKSDMACFSNWGQENLTLRRQLVSLNGCLVCYFFSTHIVYIRWLCRISTFNTPRCFKYKW